MVDNVMKFYQLSLMAFCHNFHETTYVRVFRWFNQGELTKWSHKSATTDFGCDSRVTSHLPPFLFRGSSHVGWIPSLNNAKSFPWPKLWMGLMWLCKLKLLNIFFNSQNEAKDPYCFRELWEIISGRNYDIYDFEFQRSRSTINVFTTRNLPLNRTYIRCVGCPTNYFSYHFRKTIRSICVPVDVSSEVLEVHCLFC